jgi:spermidine synthase
MHGSTTHGGQFKDARRRSEPISYYHRLGPSSDLFAAARSLSPSVRVAVVGLGTGALAAYGRPGDRFDFYEIDPEMKRMATDGRWFTYVRQSMADVHILLGDGRILLATVPDTAYDLIILDAFNSDAVPLHLLTRDAVRLYLNKLRPRGLLAFHVSSRYLDLQPVLAAEAAELGIPARGRTRLPAAPGEPHTDGLIGSVWVVMAHDSTPLNRLIGWDRLTLDARISGWTDDYSNLLAAFRR